MDNRHYARILSEVAALSQIKGVNRFKVRAFENAVRTIEGLADPIEEYIERGEVESLSGIGKSIAEDIRQIAETGTCEIHDHLLSELDPGLLDLLKIQGLGPKRIKKIYEELGVSNLATMKDAAAEGRIQQLSGLGKKTEQKILTEIDRLAKYTGRRPLPEARAVAESIVEDLEELEGLRRIAIAGSIRRGRETVGDIDILVTTDEPETLITTFVALPQIDEVLASGDTKTSVRLVDGLQVDVRIVDEEVFGSALHYFTGSKEHHIQLRTRAKRAGLKISEYGVFRVEDDERLASRTEEDVFEALDLPYIPPEIREGLGEIETAEDGELPALLEASQVRGDVHMHTTESDGRNSILEMAEAARARGLSYIALTDHSQAVTVANGMTPERFRDHMKRIREANEQMEDFEILTGIEVDILADGSLDMDHDLLAEADWVVGSVHSKFNLESPEMTDRLIKAVETGLISALGHPTGRILGGRDGYVYDFDAVVEASAEYGVAMEINGSVGRLDLNADRARAARARGVKIILGSDAHSTRGLSDMRYAVQQARRGWLEAGSVLNTLGHEELLAEVRPSIS
ncbi:MAG: DNA polymerase/3'-5' exonuclease PolX [Myxococcota bacterium]